MAHRFHLGEKTHLPLTAAEEAVGDVPEPDEPKRMHWTDGKLADFSIGQEVTVTPVQMACMVSAVANGGTVYWPRLVDRTEGGDPLGESIAPEILRRPAQVRNTINVKTGYLETVRAAMREDVASDEGSGKTSRVKGYAVCGKTGTAEIKGNGIKDKVTWFASFAPYESPRYAVIVVVESGASGGGTCGPVARQIYEYLRDSEHDLKGVASAR
jgi:penicillin-binding protein 2